MYKLLIKPEDSVAHFYTNHSTFNEGDSGLDLFIPEDVEIRCGETKIIDLKIKCEMLKLKKMENTKNRSYYLYARSSISKTPLMLKNNVGIIDAGYRGSIKAALTYVPTYEDMKLASEGNGVNIYKIDKGTRLVQLCAPNLKPFNFDLVELLSESQRGEGGFGSTDNVGSSI